VAAFERCRKQDTVNAEIRELHRAFNLLVRAVVKPEEEIAAFG
jgi:hypothetical protein